MNKKRVLWAILDLIFLVVLNTVFFTLGGTEHLPSVWIAYVFIHFSYIMLLVTPVLVRSDASAALGFPLYTLSSIYFLVELVVGVVFMFLKMDTIKVSLVTQVILTGLYAILLVSNMIANEATADAEARSAGERQYVKRGSSELKALLGSVEEKPRRKKVEAAYDLLHASPARSDSTVWALEDQVLELIHALGEKQGDEFDAALEQLTGLAEERNRRLKQLN